MIKLAYWGKNSLFKM